LNIIFLSLILISASPEEEKSVAYKRATLAYAAQYLLNSKFSGDSGFNQPKPAFIGRGTLPLNALPNNLHLFSEVFFVYGGSKALTYGGGISGKNTYLLGNILLGLRYYPFRNFGLTRLELFFEGGVSNTFGAYKCAQTGNERVGWDIGLASGGGIDIPFFKERKEKVFGIFSTEVMNVGLEIFANYIHHSLMKESLNTGPGWKIGGGIFFDFQ
jgi:hypothetical protein